jgi:rSAM/selenodomain-associated transferase 2
VEIIVADGGSRDDTPRITRCHGAKVVACPANRAGQMNRGAAAARGETLLFLHADTWLPANYHDTVLAALRRPTVVGGAFRFRIREPFRGRRLVECMTNLRARLWRMPYGDQAVFVRRWAFETLGGFPDLPIMEDYEFVRRLRRFGSLAVLDAAVLTSGRRWQRLGFLRTTLINRLVIIGYRCGVAPANLAALYRGTGPRPQQVVAQPNSQPRTVWTDESV